MTKSFQVKEINAIGQVTSSIYNAENRDDVINMIRGKGHTPVKISVAAEAKADIKSLGLFQGRIKTKDLSIYCKQMSTMLFAGMPLIESLSVIREQSTNKRMQQVAADMIDHVQKGEMLSSSMRRNDKDFPKILINMVESGEMTGNLDDVLDKMADHFAKEHKINQKIRGAMIYPAFIGVIAIVAVIFLLSVVMPTFVDMFLDAGVELPAVTQLLLTISDFIRQYWYIVIAVGIGAGYGIKKFLATTSGKRLFDRAALGLPMVKSPVAKIVTARFTRTLAILLASGIPLLESLEAAGNVTNNSIIIKGIAEVADDIKKGINLSALLSRIKVFPQMMISMVKVGEESGSIEEMLNRSAQFYEEELDEAIKQLTALIEPLMIVLMAGVVGFIVIAMMLPMFDLFKTIS